jgi:hypothetical protein
MGRLLITSYHTPGCVVHSYNDCVTTTVRWCEECKGGLFRWKVLEAPTPKLDPNPGAAVFLRKDEMVEVMRKFGPREIQFRFMLDTLEHALTEARIQVDIGQFSQAREMLLEVMLQAGTAINHVDLVAQERKRSGHEDSSGENGPG